MQLVAGGASWLPPRLHTAAEEEDPLEKEKYITIPLLQFFIYFVIVTICFNCSSSLSLSCTVSDVRCPVVGLAGWPTVASSHLTLFFLAIWCYDCIVKHTNTYTHVCVHVYL